MTDRPFATAGVTAFFRRVDRNEDAIVIRKARCGTDCGVFWKVTTRVCHLVLDARRNNRSALRPAHITDQEAS
jgi:hypothetical protein